MGAAFSTWFANNRDVYFGNATATRDFRVQLRGNRSALLFGLYLSILIGFAVFIYSNTSGLSNSSIVDAQYHLANFYKVTMGLLGLAVSVVAPALTATSIVLERQRQSIDLVFSAPVTPKYYLVGKMLSSFRYTWMLLVLALPVTAASVVMGGASWSDVLAAYMMLSLQGLMLTAIALLMSTISPKPVGAIIWSYSATILYNTCAYSAASSMIRYSYTTGGGSEAPFTVAFSPFATSETARTYTVLATHNIPNWVLLAVASVLVVKICLLGAGALLSPGGGKEIVGLRIHSLLYTAGFAWLCGWVLWPSLASRGSAGFGGADMSASGTAGALLGWATAPLIMFVPFVACFGFDRELRFRPNGWFSPRRMLDGTPAGGLPFLLAMIAVWFGGAAIGGYARIGKGFDVQFFMYAYFIVGFWVLFWSFGRLLSTMAAALKVSRTLVFAAFVLIVVLPFPFIAALANTTYDPSHASIWAYFILAPITGSRPDAVAMSVVYGTGFLGLGAMLATIAESRTRKALSTVVNYDELPVQPA